MVKIQVTCADFKVSQASVDTAQWHCLENFWQGHCDQWRKVEQSACQLCTKTLKVPFPKRTQAYSVLFKEQLEEESNLENNLQSIHSPNDHWMIALTNPLWTPQLHCSWGSRDNANSCMISGQHLLKRNLFHFNNGLIVENKGRLTSVQSLHSVLDFPLCWKAFLENTAPHQQHWANSVQKSPSQPLIRDWLQTLKHCVKPSLLKIQREIRAGANKIQ